MFNNLLHHHQQLHQRQQHQQQYATVLPHQQIPQVHAQPPPPPPAAAQVSQTLHIRYQHPHPHAHRPPRLVSTAANVTGVRGAPPAPHLRHPAAMMPPTLMGGAMLMQRMQSFSVPGGPQFTQFFMAGVRQSLLGQAHRVPPVAAVRGVRASFTPGSSSPRYPYPQTSSSSSQDSAIRLADTSKREGEQTAEKSTDAQASGSSAEGKAGTSAELEAKENDQTASQQEEPPHKRQKANGCGESEGRSPSEASHQNTVDLTSSESTAGFLQNETLCPEDEECVEKTRAAEVQGVGSSLKVTIQQTNESRAFSTGLEEPASHSEGSDQSPASSRFFCYICNITCSNQQDFQSHMNSLQHQSRLMEIQHMSSTCLAKLLPSLTDHREKRPPLQRWCATCQCHFSGDLIEHRRTREHKVSKHSSRPFCTVCKRHFRTPRKFVEHMKSREHKQKVEELREEREPELLEELITVDAIGCFEGEDDYEEESNEEEEEGLAADQSSQRCVALEDMQDDEEYDPDTQYGSSFVVPVAGFLCRLCHKFYHFESTALQSHCCSLTHFQNLQKYMRRRHLEVAQEREERGARASDLPTDEHSDPGEPEEEVPCTPTGEVDEEEEEEGEEGVDTSRAVEEPPLAHSTQKHTSVRVPPRGRGGTHKSKEQLKRSAEAGCLSGQGTDFKQIRLGTEELRGSVQSCGENPSQDSGTGDGQDMVREARLRTGPSSTDPFGRTRAHCDSEPDLTSAGAEEETGDGPAETSLPHPKDQQQQSCTTSSQRRPTSRKKSTRTT